MTPFFFSRCKGVTFTNGIDTTNNNPAKGTPLNPHNTHYYTGGSSGGTAYVVAAGLCPVACKALFDFIWVSENLQTAFITQNLNYK